MSTRFEPIHHSYTTVRSSVNTGKFSNPELCQMVWHADTASTESRLHPCRVAAEYYWIRIATWQCLWQCSHFAKI